jgi:hypothetical protein
MFNWIKSFFVKEAEAPMHYTVYIRGVEYCRAATKEAADEAIRELYASIDNKRVGGNGFCTDQNVSKKQRYNGFRQQCSIRKVCVTCGKPEGYCGQC